MVRLISTIVLVKQGTANIEIKESHHNKRSCHCSKKGSSRMIKNEKDSRKARCAASIMKIDALS